MWSEVILRPQGRGFTAELFGLKEYSMGLLQHPPGCPVQRNQDTGDL